MIKKSSGVEIPISDMEKSVVFYEDVLGLKKEYEHPVWTSFDIRGTFLALALSGTKGHKKSAKLCRGCSPCVLRFSAGMTKQVKDVPTANSVIYLKVENLDATYRKLKEKEVEFISEPKDQNCGIRNALMLDPDKNILVLYTDIR